MIAAGWSPSVRLFEAAACGTPIISDVWDGIDDLFAPDREIVLARTTADVVAALARDGAAIGAAARARVLAAHTADPPRRRTRSTIWPRRARRRPATA